MIHTRVGWKVYGLKRSYNDVISTTNVFSLIESKHRNTIESKSVDHKRDYVKIINLLG